MRELYANSDAKFNETLDNHPHNGKCGMWLISGIRHGCVVNRANTEREAYDRAIASGKVGAWEFISVDYLDPDGPEVIPI